MPRVELTAAAVEDVEWLIESHALPTDTWSRIVRSLRALERFPLVGRALVGRWHGFRMLIGPWRWMLIVYLHIEADDRVVVVTVQDARASSSPTNS